MKGLMPLPWSPSSLALRCAINELVSSTKRTITLGSSSKQHFAFWERILTQQIQQNVAADVRRRIFAATLVPPVTNGLLTPSLSSRGGEGEESVEFELGPQLRPNPGVMAHNLLQQSDH